jgi:nicotinamidase-related amidase
MKLDPKKTVVLTLDMQQGILEFVPGAGRCVPFAARVVDGARRGGMGVMHVGIGYEPGYPEIGDGPSRFSMIKEKGMFIKGTESAKTHPSLYQTGDTVLYKNRVSAFTGSPLGLILQAQKIENLILMGIATSGIVLSTLRQAGDLDYRCVVIKDACFDRDEEVHRVLTEKVFTAQAVVLNADDFLAGKVQSL